MKYFYFAFFNDSKICKCINAYQLVLNKYVKNYLHTMQITVNTIFIHVIIIKFFTKFTRKNYCRTKNKSNTIHRILYTHRILTQTYAWEVFEAQLTVGMYYWSIPMVFFLTLSYTPHALRVISYKPFLPFATFQKYIIHIDEQRIHFFQRLIKWINKYCTFLERFF